MKNRESQSKYDCCFYNIQRNHDVKRIGTKLRWENKHLPPLSLCNVKVLLYERKGVIIYSNYRSSPKIGQAIVLFIINQLLQDPRN